MTILKTITAILTVALCAGCTQKNNTTTCNSPASEIQYLLVGSYAPADSDGIKLYRFNPATADFTFVSGLSGVSNPSYQAISEDGSCFYSVSEDEGSSARAYSIYFDRENEQMSILNFSSTEGGAPCYITISPDRRHVITANYLGGNITIFPVDSAGRLLDPQLLEFSGMGSITDRQDQPHIHCISFTPDSAYMLATDLGTDNIYQFVTGSDSLVIPDSRNEITLLPGSGPRHLIWHPSGKHTYLINELSGAVTVFDYDGNNLIPRQYIQADTTGAMGSGDIRISHDGRYLYASNRLKEDGIAVFAVDPADGSLTKIGYHLTGIHPRNFIISPDDRYLLVACRDDNTIEIYRRDTESGLLSSTGTVIHTPNPVCLNWL